MEWEDAQTAWAMLQVKARGHDPIEIFDVHISFSGGGDVQIGDMTWDYEDPEIGIAIAFSTAGCDRTGIYLTYFDMPSLLAEFVAVASTGELPA